MDAAFRTEMADGYLLDEPAITLGSPMISLDVKASTGKAAKNALMDRCILLVPGHRDRHQRRHLLHARAGGHRLVDRARQHPN